MDVGADERARHDDAQTPHRTGERLETEQRRRGNARGEKQLVVTAEAKANLSDSDWCKNKFFQAADTHRVYRFDAKTQRLAGFEAYLHRPGGDVLIWATERIDYDQPVDSKVFTVELPKNAAMWKEIERLPDNEKYEKMRPKEAARAFFEACEKED